MFHYFIYRSQFQIRQACKNFELYLERGILKCTILPVNELEKSQNNWFIYHRKYIKY